MKIIINGHHPCQAFSETPLMETDCIKTSAYPPKYTVFSSHASFYPHLFQSFGYPADAPPVAELLRRYYDLEGRWVIASPVHYQTTHNDAMITNYGETLGLTDAQSRRCFESFAEFAALDEISAYYVDAATWLIRCDEKPRLQTAPVYQVLNRSLMSQLESMDQTLFWQKFITETQMSMNPVLSRRQPHAESLANGLWFWGDGDLRQTASFTALTQPRVFCQNDALLKMARLITSQVVLYQPESHTPSKHDLFLFEQLERRELEQIETSLAKFKTTWYWNNLAYTIKRAGWLSRLWSRYAN